MSCYESDIVSIYNKVKVLRYTLDLLSIWTRDKHWKIHLIKTYLWLKNSLSKRNWDWKHATVEHLKVALFQAL